MLGYESAYREHDQSSLSPEPSPAEYESPMDANFSIHKNAGMGLQGNSPIACVKAVESANATVTCMGGTTCIFNFSANKTAHNEGETIEKSRESDMSDLQRKHGMYGVEAGAQFHCGCLA